MYGSNFLLLFCFPWSSISADMESGSCRWIVLTTFFFPVSLQSSGTPIHYTYGLHRRCSSLTGTCESFPKFEDCQRDRTFCSMWRSVGFLMSFAVVVEFASMIVCLLIIGGGKQKRDNGWKVLCSVLAVTALAQCASMAIVVSTTIRRYSTLMNAPVMIYFLVHLITIGSLDHCLLGLLILFP